MGIRVAVAGASGYAGGELLRLIAGHPEFDLVAATAHSQAGAAGVGRTPAARRPGPDARPRPTRPRWPTPTWSSSPCRTASRRRSPRQLPESVKVVDLGADHRLRDAAAWDRYYGGAHAGTWTYGLPELPGQRARDRRRDPGRRHRLLRRRDHPRARAADRGRRGRARRRRGGGRLRHLRRGPVGQGAPARQRGDGRPVRRTRSARTSTCRRSSRPPARRSLSFTPVLAPMPRGILATVTARAAGRRCGGPARGAGRGVRGRAVRARPAGGQSGRTPPPPSAPTPATCRRPSTSTRAGSSWSARSTTSARAPPARPCSAPT